MVAQWQLVLTVPHSETFSGSSSKWGGHFGRSSKSSSAARLIRDWIVLLYVATRMQHKDLIWFD